MINVYMKIGYIYDIIPLYFYKSCESVTANTNILFCLAMYLIIIFIFYPHLNCYRDILLRYNIYYILHKYFFLINWRLYYISNASKAQGIFYYDKNCVSVIAYMNILLLQELFICNVYIFIFFPQLNCYTGILIKQNLYFNLFKYLYDIIWSLYYTFKASKILVIFCLVLYNILSLIFFTHLISFMLILPSIMNMMLPAFICSTENSNLIFFIKHYCDG